MMFTTSEMKRLELLAYLLSVAHEWYGGDFVQSVAIINGSLTIGGASFNDKEASYLVNNCEVLRDELNAHRQHFGHILQVS